MKPGFIPRLQASSLKRRLAGSSRRYISTETPPLVKLFDSQKWFSNFNKSQDSFFSRLNVGLFRNNMLTSPKGLKDFSLLSLKQAQDLVSTMLIEAKNSRQGKLYYIRKLDQLSDILCRVIDVAEFIRVAHPSRKWVEAAQNTHEMMFEYMNQLNTNVEMYKTLAQILDLDVAESLSDEEIEVGKYLRQDFYRSGISMDPETRNNFVAITQDISLLGSSFNNGIQNMESYWVFILQEEFDSIEEAHIKSEIIQYESKAPTDTDGIGIPLVGLLPHQILSSCASDSIRKKVWTALHNSPQQQIQILDNILKYRALLANMLGYKSFADYQLEHKMAKSPKNVIAFLKNMQSTLLSAKGGVLAEVRNLYKFKKDYNPAASDDEVLESVKPWDRDMLWQRYSETIDASASKDISEYFSVGTVMNGLNELFKSIYNVALVPQKTEKSETWDYNQVRKLSYVDLNTNETMGYLYVDFWSNKTHPSHFTIVCPRELNTEIGSETRSEMEKFVHLSSDSDYQLPVISLVCNFEKPGNATLAGESPTLLTLEQVDTIFHEMGHATHSMIGRTKLHNLSGTRCQTDFVELPSVLMESFSSDPRVICKIAKHYITGEELPADILRQHQAKRDLLKNCETFMQSKMALLDQALHDENLVDLSNQYALQNFSSTKVYHELESNLKLFSDKWSTWHGKFPHLFSYGAVYYSYLLDRAIATKVWNDLFKDDPWSREAGEKYKTSILRWGGTRDPWKCLADALNDERLSKGDETAMGVIGQL